VSLGWGVNASTTFGGTARLKIWEGKKLPKFSTFYVSGIDEYSDKI